MTTEKYLRQRVLNQNLELITQSTRIDALTADNVNLQEEIKENIYKHLTFITQLEEQVNELTHNLKTLQMDMCRTELDRSLNNR